MNIEDELVQNVQNNEDEVKEFLLQSKTYNFIQNLTKIRSIIQKSLSEFENYVFKRVMLLNFVKLVFAFIQIVLIFTNFKLCIIFIFINTLTCIILNFLMKRSIEKFKEKEMYKK